MFLSRLTPWRQQALREEMIRTGPTVAFVAASVFALFSVAHLLLLDGPVRAIMFSIAAATTGVLGFGWWAAKRGYAPAAGLVGWSVALATINSAAHLYLTGDALQTTNFILILAAVGVFILPPRPMIVAATGVIAAWAVAFPRGSAWVHFGFAVFSAAVLAGTIGALRRRTIFDLTSRSRALERARREAEESFRIAQGLEQEANAITNGIKDILVRLDEAGRIVFANAAAESSLGMQPDRLRGLAFAVLVAESNRPDYDALCAQSSAGASELRLLTRQGQHRWFDVSRNPLPRGHALLVCHDVEARRQADQLKDSLIATTGHELRTPLTSIHGALGLMQDADEATRSSLIDLALQSSDRMVRLVNQTLDLERMNRQEGLSFVDADAAELIKEATDGVAAHPHAKAVRIVVEAEATNLNCDRDKVVQVLTNLLGNALRYTPAGGTITVGSRREADGIEFSVRDDGPGVPADARGRIFEAFEQVETAADRKDGTTGLGLTISRAIVHAHGGRMWLADAPSGADFRFWLPTTQEAA